MDRRVLGMGRPMGNGTDRWRGPQGSHSEDPRCSHSDEVWQRLRAHFSDRECIDIVWLCAIERYYNMMALPLRIGSDRILANVESREGAATVSP